MTSLTAKHCVPCEGGMPPLETMVAQQLLAELNYDWALVDGKVTKQFGFKNFVKAMTFVNKVATIAEEQGHHPDLNLHDYRFVTVSLMTHAIGGLSENDFILAAKIQSTYDAE